MMDRFLLRAQLRAVLPGGVVLHASSVAENDAAFVFLAQSGGGKSTIMSKLTQKLFGAIADDSLVIARGTDGVVRCLPCGSMKQYAGTENIDGATLKAFYFLEKGSPACRRLITPEYAFYRTMRGSTIMAYGHITKNEQRQAAAFLAELFNSFPAYILRYGIHEDPERLLI
ncbi:MAG: hypothetical protein GQ565_11345 [Candidatus Aegiribacteria sp.]|nr:hypothetical protein [Candidatus Aegiribacteria sp.]